MIRSMFTAINSMYLNQQYLDVVADNLSNVNTPGFKSSFVRFKDQFAQTLSVGGAPSATSGGVNPMQIGLGTNMGTVGKTFTQGPLNSTGSDLDMAISGDGFFVYNNGTTNLYSRDGSLAIDAQGYLVHSSSGNRIQGWMADSIGTVNTGSPLSAIQLPIDSTVAKATTNAYILGNLNADMQIPVTTSNVILSGTLNASAANGTTYNSTFVAQDNTGASRNVTVQYTKTSPTSWSYNITSAGASGSGTVNFNGTGGYSSTTTTTPFVIGTSPATLNFTNLTQPAGAANDIVLGSQNGTAPAYYDVTVGVYDELGVLTSVAIRYTRTNDPNTWTYNISPTDTSGASIVDAAGNPVDNGSITFNTSGQYVSSAGVLNVPGSPGAVSPVLVTLDQSGMTMLATANSAALASQNGLAAGSLMGFTVSSKTGEIYGAYSNGDQRLVGQLALAMFVNPTGLMRDGDNYYVAGLNSGEPRIGAPNSGGRGTVASGYTEGSNVDMSREFSNMILAQRGFQASSRIINASDQILQELVNLGR